MKTTVIVTTYNSTDYLEKVLNGYLRQTRPPDELIVADDGSTDDTCDLVKSFAPKAHFPVMHVWHEDKGFRAAAIRNIATKAASGDYIIFTDGDCLPSSTFVADHLFHAEKGCFIQGRRMLLNKDASNIITEFDTLKFVLLALRGMLNNCHHLIRIPWAVSTSNDLKGIKTCNLSLFRDDITAVNGFNESFTGWGREDAEFVARLFAFGLKRKNPLLSAVVAHLWHPENSRTNLDENDLLLAQTIASGQFRCEHGIVKTSP